MTVEIRNAALLADLFGHWPDFHDAEVHSMRLDAPRGGAGSLEADIEVAEMSRELDERGYYRDRQRCRTTLRFDRVLDVRINGFSYQNVLDALEIEELSGTEGQQAGDERRTRRYRVRFVPIPAFCAVELLCDVIAVVDAAPVARAT
jgi:hypothetical protein